MRYLLICLMCCTLVSGCSEDRNEPQESSIDRATKEVADTVVEQIKTPLDKAEAVKEIEEQRRAQQEEQMK